MAVATLAVIGVLLAVYLWFWKIGLIGVMACGTGGCETVQTSRYADFLELPVALWGVFGYLAILAVALIGLQPRWLAARWPTVLLVALASGGVAFTAYLTYLEAAVIKAWCRWCLGSAAIIGIIWVISLAGLREMRIRMRNDECTMPNVRGGSSIA